MLRTLGPSVSHLELALADPAAIWNYYFYGAIGARLAQAGPWAEVANKIDPYLRRTMEAERDNGVPAAEAQARRRVFEASMESVMSNIDILAMPAMPGTAPRVGLDAPPGHEHRNAVDWSHYSYTFNPTGQPAVSLPVVLDASGLQFVGRHGNDLALLGVAAALSNAPALFPALPEFS